MMDGTFEDRVLERRATVAVCHHVGKMDAFHLWVVLLMHTAACRPRFPENSLKL